MGRFSVRSSACRPFAEISNLVIFSYRMAKWRVMLLECGGPLDAHWRDSGGRETGLTDSESNISLPRAVRQSSLRLLLPHKKQRQFTLKESINNSNSELINKMAGREVEV